MTTGDDLKGLLDLLYPICRSITGDGVRATLEIVGRGLPLEVHEVPSGTRVLDWEIPPEWNVRGAWIDGPDGERVVDFADSNLHVVGYSVPVRRRMTFEELRPHLHSLPERPEWIPYRTSYYVPTWGFCLPHERLLDLSPGEYGVVIDSTLEPGSLTYGEIVLPGATDAEVLVSAHVCHPSLANDNLSGVVVAAALAAELLRRDLRHTYRFLFAPGTIGAIAWLARNVDSLGRLRAGLVLSCLGDGGPFTYKRSRRGSALVDRVAERVLAADRGATLRDFTPDGYDERQFCSPGFDLPVGRLSRTPHGEYPEYHTSADDLSLVSGPALAESLQTLLEMVDVLEGNLSFVNASPFGEPQLGRRGLYRSAGGHVQSPLEELALLWVLNLSDGEHDLLSVAERSGLPFDVVAEAAERLSRVGLLHEPQERETGAG
jgi:aminopeptidase-like protein